MTEGVETYNARVEYLATLYDDDIIEEILSYNSAMTKADILAVLEMYHAAIARLLLKGFHLLTRSVHYGLTIKGNFTGQGDAFDPSRHRVTPQVNISPALREAILNKVLVEKELTNGRRPNPVAYESLSNGYSGNILVPGGMGKVIGELLRFDPNDAEQGIFLIAADKSERRMPPDGVIKPGSLIFMLPADLAAGDYRLEVRAQLNGDGISLGRLHDVLTVPS
jgi:hypothetical protein